MFRCKDRYKLLSKLDYLAVRCIIINLEGTRTKYLKAKLTLNALPNIYATARAGISREQDILLVVNVIYSINAAITFKLS